MVAQIGSACADIANNIFYYRTGDKTIKRYDIATNTILSDVPALSRSYSRYGILQSMAILHMVLMPEIVITRIRDCIVLISSTGDVTTADYTMSGANSFILWCCPILQMPGDLRYCKTLSVKQWWWYLLDRELHKRYS